MAAKFSHLHVHTEYSLLDGLSNIKKLFTHVKEHGMDSVAITDHGVMYGAIEFYKEAKNQGVKPIIGMEAYTTTYDHKKRPGKGKEKRHHLLLLAKNEEGYKNLMRITSLAHVEGFYYKPRIQRELLEKYSKGLICTSACAASELSQALIYQGYDSAKKIAKWFLDVFGEDYYLEVQRHEYEKHLEGVEVPEIREDLEKMTKHEKTINEGIVKLSSDLGIPIVATNDAHYIKKEDATAQDALVCIATGKNVDDVKRLRFIDAPSYYVTSPDKMSKLFPDMPEALSNSLEIADKCDLEISTLGKWFFPAYELPKGVTAEKRLRELVSKRLPTRYEKVTDELKKRAEYELDIICKKGYAAYFLIMMAMANWCEDNGIMTNTRGSAAGSLVSYTLGVTTVDPIKYYLPFERFLNPYRPSPPDIDLDVADIKRENVIQYMRDIYGEDNVAQICTFGRMLSRGAVRDVARVLDYEYSFADKIAKLIPPPKQGFPITIPKALEETPELKQLYDNDPDAKKILDLAQELEGSARHISVHAAAVVVSPTELNDFTPVQLDPSGESLITQYEMHASEDVGLIKFDILGIRNLSILGSAVEWVKKTQDKKINIRKIPLDDKKTYEMLGRGETMGVFQLSSSGMTKWLIELKPERIEDIMAMVALYRPGPMKVIPDYIARKRDPSLVEYLDPRMERFLEASYGLIVYQDDLLFCAIDLAGYTWEEADKFRKAVGKKIPEVMAEQKEKFQKGIVENGQTKKFAEKLWKLFEPFQSYGFNKAHAASYGVVAYQTAYMKANYPVEYMTSLLTAESNDTDKIAQAVSECKRMNIKVLPPDINKSDIGFTIEKDKDSLGGQAIRFGLSAIKNVGSAAIESILGAREDGDFVSFADFISRIDNRKVNKRVLESLIQVGALSEYGKRKSLLSVMDEVRNKVGKSTTNTNQQGLFGTDEIRKSMKVDNIKLDDEEFEKKELEKLEKELMGFSLTARPIGERLSTLRALATHSIEEVSPDDHLNEFVKLAAIVSEVRVVTTKSSGKQMAFVKAIDDTGEIDLVVFPNLYREVKMRLEDNRALLISGKVDNRDDSLSLLVNSLDTKETVTTNGHLTIRVPSTAGQSHLKKLKSLLLRNPGKEKVRLVFEGNGGKKMDLNMGISWDDRLARQIDKVLTASSKA